MSEVRVRTDDFEDDELDIGICWLSGEPAVHSHTVKVVNSAGWLWLLLLIGVVPFVVARALTRKSASGSLSVVPERLLGVRRRRMLIASIIFAALWITLSVAMSVGLNVMGNGDNNMSRALAGFGVAIAVGLVVLLLMLNVVKRVAPRAVFEGSGRWLRLENVHPQFAESVSRNSTQADSCRP